MPLKRLEHGVAAGLVDGADARNLAGQQALAASLVGDRLSQRASVQVEPLFAWTMRRSSGSGATAQPTRRPGTSNFEKVLR